MSPLDGIQYRLEAGHAAVFNHREIFEEFLMLPSVRTLLITAVMLGAAVIAGVSAVVADDAAGPQATSEGDFARKIEIMHSERWQRAIFEFGQWLTTQTIYSPEEVVQIKSDFNDRVARMSSYELTYLLDDLDAKLSILATPEAQDAKAWMGEYLSAMSDSKRARELQQVPDRAEMTAAQLHQEIERINRQRARLQQQQQSFEQQRQNLLDAAAANRQMTADAATAAAAARSRSGAYSPYRGADRGVGGEPPFSDVQQRSGVGMVIGPFGPYIMMGL
jgi:hypothetical protein